MLALRTQPLCCEKAQVTQKGHVYVLQSIFPTEPSLRVIPTQMPDGSSPYIIPADSRLSHLQLNLNLYAPQIAVCNSCQTHSICEH